MRAVVVGGGVGGLTTALALERIGYQVTVLEQAKKWAEVGAGIQLSPNCTRVLQELIPARELALHATEPNSMAVRHWRTGKTITRVVYGKGFKSRYQAPYFQIHREDLIDVLSQGIAKLPQIEVLRGVRVDKVNSTKHSAFANTSSGSFEGDFVIGADGLYSVARQHVAPAQEPIYAGYLAWRTVMPIAEADQSNEIATSIWWGPKKHFVQYPVRHGKAMNCVGVVEQSKYERTQWDQRGSLSEFARDFSGWHSDVGQLIGKTDPNALYKWALFDLRGNFPWHKGRVALVGDACHPMLPFMAQGAAAAIEDAAVLALALLKERTAEAALATYAAKRARRARSLQALSRRNARIFHMSGVTASTRNLLAGFGAHLTQQRVYSYDPFDQITLE